VRILIAYDGSKCADAALTDLRYAGLPEHAEVLIVSIAEQGMPVPRSIGMVETHFAEEFPDLLLEARLMARNACTRLHQYFPEWKLETEAVIGSPARVILEILGRWKPTLVVVGSHGRSALGRFFLGSVSQKVATEADASVRIARGRPREHGDELRIIVGVDGSAGAVEAVRELADRQWPAQTSVLLVTAEFSLPPDHKVGPLMSWLREEHERRRIVAEMALSILRAAGLNVRSITKEGLAKDVLLDEADAWKADCIFVGAQELNRLDRFLLGSVSAAVAGRAHCSVEVVRRGDQKK
jgi:nucleotide-binding universal stress UspA family protein